MRTILVVADSPTKTERLELLLTQAGYRVHLASDGGEGLARARGAPPDLIISDVTMPHMDGYELCRAIKSSERLRRIPFVLLTGRPLPMDVLRGFECGADNFITWPFEDEHLVQRIGRIFDNVEPRRSGHLDAEIALDIGERRIAINPDKRQVVELLLATLEEVVRLDEKLRERAQQLLQAGKVATLGALLAGVAHDLNNPLAILAGQANLLAEGLAEFDGERVEKIARAADRCSRIVKNFLALARQGAPERSIVSLNEVVRGAAELVAYPFRMDGIEVTLDLAEHLPVLWADSPELHQLVVNLLTNAHQAMRGRPGPRRIAITTRRDREADRVCLEIADTGPGIPREIIGRIFEPFFTTRPAGQGTGLGLALCREIVERHHGSITASSAAGTGAVFTVALPLEEPADAPPTVDAGTTAEPVGSGRILVIDDEPGVCEVLADVLAADGHTVDTVTGGLAALERLRERAYDLILTDIRMPGLDGPDLYRELVRSRQELAQRVIFLTGDTLSEDLRRALEELGRPTISKPFNFDELRSTVRRSLRS